jgi:hypothetical protein
MNQTKVNVQEKIQNNFLTSWALLYLIAAIGIGLLLRSIHFISLPLAYGNLLHTHSHGAFLGWVYLGLNSLLFSYTNKLTEKTRNYFIVQLIILPFLFIGFSLYGYNTITIILSSLQIIISWIIGFIIIKELGVSSLWRFNASNSLIVAGQGFMMFSGLFPFMLGAIIKTFGNTSVFYYDAIYTYLHFQYNGFFTCSIIYFLFFYSPQTKSNPSISKLFYYTFVSSILLLSAHNFLWSIPPTLLYYISLLGSILQFVSAFFLFKMAKGFYPNATKITKVIIAIFMFCFITKCLLQIISSIPYFVTYLPNNRDLIIAYLHLVLIGMISIPLLFLLYKPINFTFKIRNLLVGLILSFFGAELFLFLRGIDFLPNYFSGNYWTNGIFICSLLLFITISVVGISTIKKDRSNSKAVF